MDNSSLMPLLVRSTCTLLSLSSKSILRLPIGRFLRKASSSNNSTLLDLRRKQPEEGGYTSIYKVKGMAPLRALVRLKLLQFAGIGASIFPFVSLADMATAIPVSVVIFSGTVGGSLAMFYFSKRIVGELAVSEDNQYVKVSTLDFWGGRKEEVFPARTIEAPLLSDTFDTPKMDTQGTSLRSTLLKMYPLVVSFSGVRQTCLLFPGLAKKIDRKKLRQVLSMCGR